MENFQSRFITNFHDIHWLADTPKQAIQGFVVDLQCDNYDTIFQQVSFFQYSKRMKKISYWKRNVLIRKSTVYCLKTTTFGYLLISV